MSNPSLNWRHASIGTLILAVAAAALLLEPISQPLAYHDFVDQRTLLGLINALNRLSNLPFLLVGLLGLHHCWRKSDLDARYAWQLFFFGVAMVAFGSDYYHAAPDNRTLVWDRLPMTIAFMGLFIALLSEQFGRVFERYCLFPALIMGVFSVAYWHYSGDLRPYLLVQFTPLLVIPFIVLLFPPRNSHRSYLLYALLFYLAAKLCEFFDGAIYQLSGHLFSGHTLKHLLAAGAVMMILRMVQCRQPILPSQDELST